MGRGVAYALTDCQRLSRQRLGTLEIALHSSAGCGNTRCAPEVVGLAQLVGAACIEVDFPICCLDLAEFHETGDAPVVPLLLECAVSGLLRELHDLIGDG